MQQFLVEIREKQKAYEQQLKLEQEQEEARLAALAAEQAK
jgi:hypothetical protein